MTHTYVYITKPRLQSVTRHDSYIRIHHQAKIAERDDMRGVHVESAQIHLLCPVVIAANALEEEACVCVEDDVYMIYHT
jgi:hypothetical protein